MKGSDVADTEVTPAVLDTLRSLVREVPDFPKPGILFRDITPLLGAPEGLRLAIDAMCSRARPLRPDLVVAIEARGFILGAPIALRLGCGFSPIRKPGKLPYKTRRRTYALEYGTDTQEIHADAIRPGQRVLIVDDVLATGGTLAGAVELVRECGGTPSACAVLVELSALRGRSRLPGVEVQSLLVYA
jgi:adenine phosphoribosyltransferase